MESKGQALCWKAGHRLISTWAEVNLVQIRAVRNDSRVLFPGAAVCMNRGRAVKTRCNWEFQVRKRI